MALAIVGMRNPSLGAGWARAGAPCTDGDSGKRRRLPPLKPLAHVRRDPRPSGRRGEQALS